MSVDQFATGKYMKRMGFWASDRCPRCLHANKTTMHVLQCQELSAMQLMVKLQANLWSKLQQFPTSNATIDLIDHILFSNLWNLPPQEQELLKAQKLMEDQLQLPLSEFRKGRLVKIWNKRQEEYLQRTQSQRTATKWTQTLIQELWNIFFQMWLYRNEAFHTDEQTQDTQQLQQIDNEIWRQWTIGTQGLDNAEKLHFQNQTLAQILHKTWH